MPLTRWITHAHEPTSTFSICRNYWTKSELLTFRLIIFSLSQCRLTLTSWSLLDIPYMCWPRLDRAVVINNAVQLRQRTKTSLIRFLSIKREIIRAACCWGFNSDVSWGLQFFSGSLSLTEVLACEQQIWSPRTQMTDLAAPFCPERVNSSFKKWLKIWKKEELIQWQDFKASLNFSISCRCKKINKI